MSRLLTAVGCGLTGTFLCLQFSPVFWWVGLLLSFALGYVMYDLRASLKSINAAWIACRENIVWELNWKQAFRGITEGFSLVAMILCTGTLFFIVGASWLWPVAKAIETISDKSLFAGFDEVLAFMALSTMAGFFLTIAVHNKQYPDWSGKRMTKSRQNFWMFFWHGSSPRVAYLAIRHLPAGIRLLKRLGYTWYQMVHSHERMLFAIDVAIGTGIGYACHNVLIGGLIAGTWWSIDHYVIAPRVLRKA